MYLTNGDWPDEEPRAWVHPDDLDIPQEVLDYKGGKVYFDAEVEFDNGDYVHTIYVSVKPDDRDQVTYRMVVIRNDVDEARYWPWSFDRRFSQDDSVDDVLAFLAESGELVDA